MNLILTETFEKVCTSLRQRLFDYSVHLNYREQPRRLNKEVQHNEAVRGGQLS